MTRHMRALAASLTVTIAWLASTIGDAKAIDYMASHGGATVSNPTVIVGWANYPAGSNTSNSLPISDSDGTINAISRLLLGLPHARNLATVDQYVPAGSNLQWSPTSSFNVNLGRIDFGSDSDYETAAYNTFLTSGRLSCTNCIVLLVDGPQATRWYKNDACGYHTQTSAFHGYKPYAVVPVNVSQVNAAVAPGSCGANDLSQGTNVTFHELAEATTNPTHGGFWDDATGSEVGDVPENWQLRPNQMSAGAGVSWLQPLWSNDDGGSVYRIRPWSEVNYSTKAGSALNVFHDAGWQVLSPPAGKTIVTDPVGVADVRSSYSAVRMNDGHIWVATTPEFGNLTATGWNDWGAPPYGTAVGRPAIASWGYGNVHVFTTYETTVCVPWCFTTRGVAHRSTNGGMILSAWEDLGFMSGATLSNAGLSAVGKQITVNPQTLANGRLDVVSLDSAGNKILGATFVQGSGWSWRLWWQNSSPATATKPGTLAGIPSVIPRSVLFALNPNDWNLVFVREAASGNIFAGNSLDSTINDWDWTAWTRPSGSWLNDISAMTFGDNRFSAFGVNGSVNCAIQVQRTLSPATGLGPWVNNTGCIGSNVYSAFAP